MKHSTQIVKVKDMLEWGYKFW